jgi:hypothetical protein
VFCDTLPYLRAIIASEDVQEVLYHETLAEQRDDMLLDTRVRRSRRLAEAGKEKFPRHAGLDGEIAECIRRSAFAAADLL